MIDRAAVQECPCNGHSVELSKIQPVTPRRQDMGLRDVFARFIHNDVHNNRG